MDYIILTKLAVRSIVLPPCSEEYGRSNNYTTSKGK